MCGGLHNSYTHSRTFPPLSTSPERIEGMNCQLFNSVSAQLISLLSQIEYVQDTFHLRTPYEAFQFFFELHNLPSAFRLGSKARNAFSHLTTLNIQVQDANLGPYSKKMQSDGPKRTKTQEPEPNAAPPGGSSLCLNDDVSTVCKLSDAGCKLLRTPEILRCYPIFPVGSSL